MNIIVMGPQGSGKSTQAKLLAEKLGVLHVSTGDIYRKISNEDSDLGRHVKEFLDQGKLIDDETTFSVVDKHLGEITQGFVVDGFPRTKVQAEREVFPVDKVIFLSVPREESVKRLLDRGRADDTENVILERLRLYESATLPILDYYQKKEKLIEIDGRPAIEDVHRAIVRALNI